MKMLRFFRADFANYRTSRGLRWSCTENIKCMEASSLFVIAKLPHAIVGRGATVAGGAFDTIRIKVWPKVVCHAYPWLASKRCLQHDLLPVELTLYTTEVSLTWPCLSMSLFNRSKKSYPNQYYDRSAGKYEHMTLIPWPLLTIQNITTYACPSMTKIDLWEMCKC